MRRIAVLLFATLLLAACGTHQARIAFTSNRDGNWEIYVMNADGSGQTCLTDNSADDWDSAWSPDGCRIAFTSNRDDNYDIYVMNAAPHEGGTGGSGLTYLTGNSAWGLNPDWSP